MLSITPTCRDDHRRWPSFSSGGTYRYILSSFSPCLFIYLFVCLSLFAYACASVRVCCFFLLFFPFSRGRENDEQANRFGSIRLLSRPGDAARLPHYAETRQCKLVIRGNGRDNHNNNNNNNTTDNNPGHKFGERAAIITMER